MNNYLVKDFVYTPMQIHIKKIGYDEFRQCSNGELIDILTY